MPLNGSIFSREKRCLAVLLLYLLTAGYSPAVTVPETVVLADKQVIAFVRAADSGRIFTVSPAGKRGPAQRLDFAAVRALAELITTPEDIWPPLGMPIPAPNVGIEFDLGENKYVLYTSWEFRCFYDHFEKPGDTQRMTYLDIISGKDLQLAQAWQQKYFPRPISSPPPAH